MMKTTVLMAAVLAVAIVLAVGLTVLPGSVQEAHANPCSVISQNNEANNDVEDFENEIDCDFENGSFDIEG
jgi:hypothetical protein